MDEDTEPEDREYYVQLLEDYKAALETVPSKRQNPHFYIPVRRRKALKRYVENVERKNYIT